MNIYTLETFDYSRATPGDLVAQEVVDQAMNALIPACMTARCAQMGEPFAHVPDHQGRWRATYATFSKVCEGVWEYRGHCYRGEVEEPVTEPVYAML